MRGVKTMKIMTFVLLLGVTAFIGACNNLAEKANRKQPTYTVGLVVSGLKAQDQGLVIQSNAADNLSINTNGSFTFKTALEQSSSYEVTVLNQPSNPSQTCSVENGSGKIGTAPVQNVIINCAPTVISGKFSGSGTVSIYTFSKNTKNLMASADFIDAFEVGIEPTISDHYVLVEISKAKYKETPYGDEVGFLDNQKMAAVGRRISGEKAVIHVTPMTHVMTAYILYLLNKDYTLEEAYNTALNVFNEMYDIDITEEPFLITDNIIANSIDVSQFRYGLLLSGISRMMLGLNPSGITRFSPYNSVELSQAAYLDLKGDGMVDGKNSGVDIYIDNAIYDSEYLRHKLAINIFGVAKEFLQPTPTDKTAYLTVSQKINDQTNILFNNVTPVALDEGGPRALSHLNIFRFEPYGGIGGTATYRASVRDLLEVSSIEYFIDEKLVYKEANPSVGNFTFTYNLALLSLTPGEHSFKMLVTNILGSTGGVSFPFF